MIQRKQSVYLLLAAIFCLMPMFMRLASVYVCLPEDGACSMKTAEGMDIYSLMLTGNNALIEASPYVVCPLFLVLLLGVVGSVYTIFLYEKRKLQIRLCTYITLLLVLWHVAASLLYVSLVDTAHMTMELCVPFFFPFIAIIFVLLARRGVIKDEKLIRDCERIR